MRYLNLCLGSQVCMSVVNARGRVFVRFSWEITDSDEIFFLVQYMRETVIIGYLELSNTFWKYNGDRSKSVTERICM